MKQIINLVFGKPLPFCTRKLQAETVPQKAIKSLVEASSWTELPLTLIIGESALETVPQNLWAHPAVAKHAARQGKLPGEILLDRSYHHAAMLSLPNAFRRGRPDIVHFSLLEATSSPLYLLNKLRVLVHTVNDYVVSLGEKVRLPKAYPRFAGLMEGLFGQATLSRPSELLHLQRMGLPDLITREHSSLVVGLSRLGEKSSAEDVATLLFHEKNPVLVVGGFPKGHFTRSVELVMDRILSVDDFPLEAHVVVARTIYEYEKRVRVS